MFKKYRTKAFTLVELIVVITILAVLATIAFVSFQGYVLSSRDSVRLSDIKSMGKVVTIFKQQTGKYPLPNENTNINYSGSVAWSQGIFGQNAYSDNLSMSNIPTDPQTLLAYPYSVTSSRQEYQIATVLEGETSRINNTTFAGDQIVKAYVKGDYNGSFLKVNANSTSYLLGLPSILASNINDIDLINILNNQKLVYKGYNNLPASYSGSIYNSNPSNGFNFVANQVVLFEGNISELEKNQDLRIEFFNKLQTYYSGTEISTEKNIAAILLIDSSSDIKSNNYAVQVLNNTLKTKIALIEDPDPVITENIPNETPCVFGSSVFSTCGL